MGNADDDNSYITKIRHKVNLALSDYAPDFVIYVAGYDVLSGDKFGKMGLSESIVILRDELIFREVVEDQAVPILMVIGGCYQKRQETVIARSIRNLVIKLDLSPKPIQGSTAQNIKMNQKLTRMYNRYDNEELGFSQGTGTRGTHMQGEGRTNRSSINRPLRTAISREGRGSFGDDHTVVSATDAKYTQIYKQLEKGLYDRNSIGKTDVFSKGK